MHARRAVYHAGGGEFDLYIAAVGSAIELQLNTGGSVTAFELAPRRRGFAGERELGILDEDGFHVLPFDEDERPWLYPEATVGDFDGEGHLDLLLAVGCTEDEREEGRGPTSLHFYPRLRSPSGH